MTMISRRLKLGLCVAAALCATVACGGPPDPAPSVASLPTGKTSASTGATATGSTVDRHPRQTLNTTDAEWWGWTQVYWKCLKDHGVPYVEKEPGTLAPKDNDATIRGRNPAYNGAFDQCEPIKPLPAPELSPDTNPHYMDGYRKEIACLNNRGLKVTPLPNGGGWNYDGRPTMSQDEQAKVQFDCRKEAYRAG
ncbi:hypothetical protein [Amycolatopsis sp. MtRt-6]|uniref:hypothetical protein n=1 Tax=Amycolatopsis sp. MtRt-6 TaxID=2792782 RepID=UPI001A8C7FFB|nr:hypothetical protein [Amycolatopsis sp. MtRt-6]